MLRARLATAAIAIPLLLLLIFEARDGVFAFVLALAGFAAVAEYVNMAFPDRWGERGLGMIMGLLVGVGAAGPDPGLWLGAALALSVILGLVWVLFARRDFERGLTDLGLLLLGVLFCALLLPHFTWLRRLEHGPGLVFFVLAVAMVGDSGGYFVGHAFGKHKLAPRVSPGKTVEGGLGILACSLLAGLLAKFVLGACGAGLATLSWKETALLALGMGVLGQLGDLGESVMKRTFGVKESGWIFPGHGGILDRIDSLLFPVVFVYYYFRLFP